MSVFRLITTIITQKLRQENAMKSYFKVLVIVVQFLAILTVGMMFRSSDVWAKEKGGALEKQIQGTWSLVSIFVEKDGEKIDVFGANPRGSMILTPNGRFSVIMMNASLPKFAANSRVKGTTEENQAVVKGSLAWFGSYKIVNAKEQMVIFNIEGSTYPNWTGEEQKLIMTVTGDEMKVINPSAAIGGKGYPTWKRVK
jgi:hypothetical protein